MVKKKAILGVQSNLVMCESYTGNGGFDGKKGSHRTAWHCIAGLESLKKGWLRKGIGEYAASVAVDTTAYWRYQCHETTMWESSVCGTSLSESSRQAQAAKAELEKGSGPGFL